MPAENDWLSDQTIHYQQPLPILSSCNPLDHQVNTPSLVSVTHIGYLRVACINSKAVSVKGMSQLPPLLPAPPPRERRQLWLCFTRTVPAANT